MQTLIKVGACLYFCGMCACNGTGMRGGGGGSGLEAAGDTDGEVADTGPVEDESGRSADAAAPPCLQDAECNDGQSCTVDACVEGTCLNLMNDDADSDGDGVADCADNCALTENPDQADFDEDGIGDTCDEDDDNDGFRDQDDPAPRDAQNPGDFSTLEAILADERVQKAFAELEDAGYLLDIHDGTTPNLRCGEFRWEAGTGEFVATGNGSSVGQKVVGEQSTWTPIGDNRIEVSGFSFEGDDTLSVSTAIADVRGTSDEMTMWSAGSKKCVESGSYFILHSVSFTSSAVELHSGEEIDELRFGVTVATTGDRSRECDDRIAGNGEVVGGWAAWIRPEPQQVGPCPLP